MRIQDIFNKVARHLLTQNKPAWSTISETCVYRTKSAEGKLLMCAVGCLIPANVYDYGIEGLGPYHPLVKNTLDLAGVLSVQPKQRAAQVEFLVNLQGIHDDHQPDCWKEELRILAAKHHLNRSVLKEFP